MCGPDVSLLSTTAAFVSLIIADLAGTGVDGVCTSFDWAFMCITSPNNLKPQIQVEIIGLS